MGTHPDERLLEQLATDWKRVSHPIEIDRELTALLGRLRSDAAEADGDLEVAILQCMLQVYAAGKVLEQVLQGLVNGLERSQQLLNGVPGALDADRERLSRLEALLDADRPQEWSESKRTMHLHSIDISRAIHAVAESSRRLWLVAYVAQQVNAIHVVTRLRDIATARDWTTLRETAREGVLRAFALMDPALAGIVFLKKVSEWMDKRARDLRTATRVNERYRVLQESLVEWNLLGCAFGVAADGKGFANEQELVERAQQRLEAILASLAPPQASVE